MEGAGTKEHSVAGDWTKCPEGGKQFWRGRDRRAKRGVSVTGAETCDWRLAGGVRGCGALEQVDVGVAGSV